MNKQATQVTFLDGAMGTQMQAHGMSGNVCPEQWALNNPDALREVYQSYLKAGSENILTFTFGASRYKLEEYDLGDQVNEINEQLAKIAREEAPEGALVGGDIGPLGALVEPLGEIEFEEAVAYFREQADALAKGGVDYIAIETMLDIREARAAVIGVREACDLPIRATLTFENGRTLTGTLPATAVVTLQSMGVSEVGSNCGAGPVQMLPIIEEMVKYATIPVVAKPNAGLPVLIDGITTYDLSPEDFAYQGEKLALAGARFIGGCCGSTPEHIRQLHERLNGLTFMPIAYQQRNMLSSARQCIECSDQMMMANINLAVRQEWLENIIDDDYDDIFELLDMIEDAEMLCISAKIEGMTDEEEANLLAGLTDALSNYSPIPMAFRPACSLAAEKVLRYYPGRALLFLDQVETDAEKQAIAQMAEYYGALII